ncbi:hypothetical protein CKO23_22070 [Thiocystis violacea]|nr:hypothetical protein [Thiocystis violacea]
MATRQASTSLPQTVRGGTPVKWRAQSAETALRLARVFGTSVELWMNLQQCYELECAKDALGDTLEQIKPIGLAA